MRRQAIVCSGFDDIKSRDLRFLQEAAKLGELTVALWTDDMIRRLTSKAPRFPLAERLYFLCAVRFVDNVIPCSNQDILNVLPKALGRRPDIWADIDTTASAAREKFARENMIDYHVFYTKELILLC